MSYFDPLIINKTLPAGWEEYELHTEVNESDHLLIQHLEKTKWEHITDGGFISGSPNGRDNSTKTKWYGLKRNIVSSDELNDKPFFMSGRGGNKPDYNSFGHNEYKQYDI